MIFKILPIITIIIIIPITINIIIIIPIIITKTITIPIVTTKNIPIWKHSSLAIQFDLPLYCSRNSDTWHRGWLDINKCHQCTFKKGRKFIYRGHISPYTRTYWKYTQVIHSQQSQFRLIL